MLDADRAIDFIRGRFKKKITTLSLDRAQRGFLKQITEGAAGNGFLPMSHFGVRHAASDAMVTSLLDHSRAEGNRDVKYFMATFCWDDGFTWLNNPRVDLKKMRRKIDKAMRAYGLHGVYLIEVEILLRQKGEPSPRLMFHVHAICWRRSSKILPRKLGKEMSASRSFPNNLGARSVVFTTSHPQTPSSIAGLGQYITKFPACVKKVRKLPSGRCKMRHEQSKYSGIMVLRMIEMLSHIPLYSAVGAVGEGTAVRRAWKAKLTAWREAQPTDAKPLTKKMVRLGWKNAAFRAQLKGKPCKIVI